MDVLLLLTQICYCNCHVDWEIESPHKYLKPADFCQTGMTQTRFDALWKLVCFRGKVEINLRSQWARNYSPSDLICVDEFISC